MKKIVAIVSIGSVLSFSACNEAEVAAENRVKTYEERVIELETKINENAEWKALIEKKAKEQNIPFDSMLHNDIRWMIDEEDGKHKQDTAVVKNNSLATRPYAERLQEMINKIRQDEKWLALIKQKAAEKKISVDSMLVLDAGWMIDEEDGKHK